MWVIIALSIALANPDRPLERLQDRLKQRNYALLQGDGPVYGSKYGRIEAWVFPDGIIQRYQRSLTENKIEIKRFSATGLPLTRLVNGPNGPLDVKVYGSTDYSFDVEGWKRYTSHNLTLRVPREPNKESEDTHRWDFPEGTLTISEEKIDNPYSSQFISSFQSSCRCKVVDRNTTWLQSRRALRLRLEQPLESRTQYGDLWLIPVGKKLVTVQWIANEGGHFDRSLAKGRAMVALIEEIISP